jgi:hypothetical protein
LIPIGTRRNDEKGVIRLIDPDLLIIYSVKNYKILFCLSNSIFGILYRHFFAVSNLIRNPEN